MKEFSTPFFLSKFYQLLTTRSIHVHKICLAVILLFYVMVDPCFSQDKIHITAKVTGENNVPLTNVSIIEKGSQNSVRSDKDGNFAIVISDSGRILFFSHVGYTSLEIPVSSSFPATVRLSSVSSRLDSVVVVGYGSQRKSTLTGAVASINSGDIANRPNANISNALQGKIAGVNVTQVSGEPGSPPIIRIRGIGTINNNDPLMVVDGVPVGLDNSVSLSPETIERVEVLKDASASAIYGSRGSNGVILITTKRGTSGKPVFSVNSYVGFSEAIKRPPLMNSETFYQYQREAYENAGAPFVIPPQVTAQYDDGYSTNWFDQVTQRGFTQNHNISFRGGSDFHKYNLSMGYYKEEGYVKTTDYSRVNLNVNNDITPSKWLKIGNTLNVSFSQRIPIPPTSLYSVYGAVPFAPVINPDANKDDPEYEFNKYAAVQYGYYPNAVGDLAMNFQKTNSFYVNGNLFAEIQPLKGLYIKSQFGIDKSYSRFTNFLPSFKQEYDERNLVAYIQLRLPVDRQFIQNSTDVFNFTWNNTVRYERSFGDHSLSLLGGFVLDKRSFELVNASVKGIPGNDPSFRTLGSGTDNYLVSGSRYPQAIQSYIGRINYDYAGKYLLTASFRADGSSNFEAGNKWGYFPALSVGWKFTDEQFLRNINPSFLSFGKIRAGWGITGNDAAYGAAVTAIGAYGRYPFNGVLQQAYSQISVGNSGIRWEQGEQLDIGLDAAFLNNRLSMSFDWYNKKTNGMILQVPLPNSAGYPNTPYSNAGDMQNKGIEITLGYRKAQGAFTYDVSVNFDAFRNKVLSLGSPNGSFVNIYNTSKTTAGRSVGEFFGAVFEGVFQTQQEIDNYVDKNGTKLQPNARPGDLKFKKILNDGEPIGGGDIDYIGSPFPKYSFGLTANMAFKNFDLSLFFQGTQGNKIWSLWQGRFEMPSAYWNGFVPAYTDAWRGEGTSNYYPRLVILGGPDPNNNYRNSSWFVHDASYVRMKNLQLGYTFPASLVSKFKITSLRVYASGTNLFTITKYPGLDPEQGDPDPKIFGLDDVTVRIPRVFTLGLNVQF